MTRRFEVSGGSQKALRSLNEKRIIDVLARNGEMTQANIARETSLAASTVSNIVSDLVDQQVLERKENLGGPHGQLIGLIPAPGAVVGIDVGKRHLTVALSNFAHEIIAETQVDLPANHHHLDDIELMDQALSQLSKSVGLKRSEIHALGLAIAAPIDMDRRKISASQVMLEWADIDIPTVVETALQIPTFIDNDANLGAIGEQFWGAAQGFKDLIYIKVADGIGAGLVLDGQIYRGADGSAGEIGHNTIDDSGMLCQCGNRGCLETVASIGAILKIAEPIFGPDINILDLIEKAQQGNNAALRVLEDTGRSLGVALANLVNTLNPSIVVVGGLMSEAGELLLTPLRSVLERYAVRGAVKNLKIERTQLGSRANVLGAVSLALDSTNR